MTEKQAPSAFLKQRSSVPACWQHKGHAASPRELQSWALYPWGHSTVRVRGAEQMGSWTKVPGLYTFREEDAQDKSSLKSESIFYNSQDV